MKNISQTILLGLILMVGLAGCKSTVNSVSREEPLAKPDVVNSHVTITDNNLNNSVSVQKVVQTKLPWGLIKIQVHLLNTTNDHKYFNYKFEWFNTEGILVETSTSAWRPDSILGAEQKVISATAPSPDVVDFQLKLQAAKH